MDILPYLLVFVFSLAIGSFLGALTYRIPRGIEITKGRSFCPKCKANISWRDNIPLISYLLLRGKCRRCQNHISLRYPLIEGLTAIGATSLCYLYVNCQVVLLNDPICQWKSGAGNFGLTFLFFLTFIAVAIFVIDFENKLIFDEFSLSLFALASVILILTNPADLWQKLATGFVGASFLLVIHLITRGRGMGLGDVKLALALGAILGIGATLTWLYISFILGALAGILLISLGKAKLGREIAFGPYLIAGFFIALVLGDSIASKLFSFLL